MGKGLEGWSVRHLLMVSVALNVWLVLKLAYYDGNTNFATERIFNGFCANEKLHKQSPFTSSSSSSLAVAAGEKKAITVDDGRVINLDHGDPTMYERYWQQAGDKTSLLISGWHSMSYFSDIKNLCWFLEPQFAKEVIRLHDIVGNAVTKDRHIVVGTGSTQLFQAALYALSSPGGTKPISVVSSTPYYSFYRQVVEYLKSGLYTWAGDAAIFDKDEPYIELITSPNNPDGFMRQPIVNRSGGMLIHDFAYYWPQYTPITSPADHEIMLFTVSKTTGHAGMRIGWAIVKDKEVAKRMTKFIELNSIGVSKDSQLRAAKILQAVSDSCEPAGDSRNFFETSYHHVAHRWQQLRKAVEESRLFSTPEFPAAFCNYTGRLFSTQPAFAWLKCKDEIENCEDFLRSHKILTRSGKHFGMSLKFVRISMLDRDSNFDLFIKRLSEMRL
ncbi:tryptophan aminotransferase-related protein 2-like [Chenopodium quinoa]|nr:tryptophan aminotransferase-related protein 2-like [Chenopodium quinoa]